mgnify:CR=1 FL=1
MRLLRPAVLAEQHKPLGRQPPSAACPATPAPGTGAKTSQPAIASHPSLHALLRAHTTDTSTRERTPFRVPARRRERSLAWCRWQAVWQIAGIDGENSHKGTLLRVKREAGKLQGERDGWGRMGGQQPQKQPQRTRRGGVQRGRVQTQRATESKRASDSAAAVAAHAPLLPPCGGAASCSQLTARPGCQPPQRATRTARRTQPARAASSPASASPENISSSSFLCADVDPRLNNTR